MRKFRNNRFSAKKVPRNCRFRTCEINLTWLRSFRCNQRNLRNRQNERKQRNFTKKWWLGRNGAPFIAKLGFIFGGIWLRFSEIRPCFQRKKQISAKLRRFRSFRRNFAHFACFAAPFRETCCSLKFRRNWFRGTKNHVSLMLGCDAIARSHLCGVFSFFSANWATVSR